MKINPTSRWLNALIIGGSFAIIGVGFFYLHEEAYYDFRRDFRRIEAQTYLAECTDKDYPDSIYGNGFGKRAKYWLVGRKLDGENEVSIYPLIKGWTFSDLMVPDQGLPQKWKPVSQARLQKEFGAQSNTYSTVFTDETLKCEVLLRDVNEDGKLDVVLRKSQTLKGSDESATDTYTCAYEIRNGKVHFLEE